MKTDSKTDESLERIQRQLGFLPNLFKEMSQAPAVLGVYLKGQEALSKGSLTAKEQQVVQLTVAVYNDELYLKVVSQED
jgi:alkylhydroperoxidase/carboxymuconolactone decarboxylase family protein YurZ